PWGFVDRLPDRILDPIPSAERADDGEIRAVRAPIRLGDVVQDFPWRTSHSHPGQSAHSLPVGPDHWPQQDRHLAVARYAHEHRVRWCADRLAPGRVELGGEYLGVVVAPGRGIIDATCAAEPR